MANLEAGEVQEFFDRQASFQRSLIPPPTTVGGWGTYAKYARAAELMAEKGVRRALDVGCNRGQIELLFHQLHPAAAGEIRVDGVDISRESIRQATSLELADCLFQAYDGITLPFGTATFDLVVLVEVIEHVPDKHRLISEIARVLRPGGRLFLTTPNPDSAALHIEHAIWRILRRIFRRRQWNKDAFITHDALVDLLADAGFEVERGEQLYAWPHVFIHFLGWSLMPPLWPTALFEYQKICVRCLEGRRLPKWLAKRCKWSLVALVRRESPASAVSNESNAISVS